MAPRHRGGNITAFVACTFTNPESVPVHKGLIAVDSVKGGILWQNFNNAFDHLTVNGPLLFDTRLAPGSCFWLISKWCNAEKL